jgi:hypothetical protein
MKLHFFLKKFKNAFKIMKLFFIFCILISTSICNAQSFFSLSHFKKNNLDPFKIAEFFVSDFSVLVCFNSSDRQETQFLNVAFSGNLNIYMYDLLGNIIFYEKKFFEPGQCREIQLIQNRQGIFFLHITNGLESITKKIVIQ